MNETKKKFSALLGFLLCLPSFSEGPSIKVYEYDKDGTKINTFELNSDPPKKELVTKTDGVDRLNINSNNLQEVGVKKLLDTNFAFSHICNYEEIDDFYKKHPGFSPEKTDEMFTEYVEKNHIKLRKREECFATELKKLLAAHPCLQKRATIEFYVMPDDAASYYNYRSDSNDDRRVVGVILTGCPYGDPNQVLNACTYKRDRLDGKDWLGSGRWSEFVKDCTAEFKKPEIRQMADATMNRAHTR